MLPTGSGACPVVVPVATPTDACVQLCGAGSVPQSDPPAATTTSAEEVSQALTALLKGQGLADLVALDQLVSDLSKEWAPAVKPSLSTALAISVSQVSHLEPYALISSICFGQQKVSIPWVYACVCVCTPPLTLPADGSERLGAGDTEPTGRGRQAEGLEVSCHRDRCLAARAASPVPAATRPNNLQSR